MSKSFLREKNHNVNWNFGNKIRAAGIPGNIIYLWEILPITLPDYMTTSVFNNHNLTYNSVTELAINFQVNIFLYTLEWQRFPTLKYWNMIRLEGFFWMGNVRELGIVTFKDICLMPWKLMKYLVIEDLRIGILVTRCNWRSLH